MIPSPPPLLWKLFHGFMHRHKKTLNRIIWQTLDSRKIDIETGSSDNGQKKTSPPFFHHRRVKKLHQINILSILPYMILQLFHGAQRMQEERWVHVIVDDWYLGNFVDLSTTCNVSTTKNLSEPLFSPVRSGMWATPIRNHWISAITCKQP